MVKKPGQHAEVLPTHTPKLFEQAVRRAAELLRAGEVVALPTETVYGLAANALNEAAVACIYEIKGRPAANPLIVHVANLEMAQSCASDWPSGADDLARAFWPGPLTIVVPAAPIIPKIVTAGGPTVGVRWPSHPFIQAVIRECDFPLAAPSANPSNRISATNAEHVHADLGDKLNLIIDGGQSQIGIESTVLDLAQTPPRILRPGMIQEPALLAVIGSLATGESDSGAGPYLRSPGQLRKHYSPLATLILISWRSDEDLRRQLSQSKVPPAKIQIIAHTHIPSGAHFGRVSVIPHDAPAFARAIYAELRQCDLSGAELIVVESPPNSHEWRAILDRLKRAAAA